MTTPAPRRGQIHIPKGDLSLWMALKKWTKREEVGRPLWMLFNEAIRDILAKFEQLYGPQR